MKKLKTFSQPQKKKSITIVLPALNEEKAIGKVIDEIPKEKLEKEGYEVEIIVVDNNSTDNTGEIARKSGARVILEKNRGYGRAYKTGLSKAKGDIIITGDADLSYPMENIPELVKILEEEELDFITTNRFGKLENGSMSFRNYIGNLILNYAIRVLFRIDIKDSQSGMWIFRKGILSDLKLTSDGMSFSEEIKIEALSNGFKWKEVPISYRKRVGEKKLNPWKDGFKNLLFLVKKRFGD